MNVIGRMMSVTDGTEADVMSMADRPAGQPERPDPRRLTRSKTDRMIAGVCGGFAAYSGIDATIVRLVMVLLAVLGGTGVLLYLIAWVIVPAEDAAQARGAQPRCETGAQRRSEPPRGQGVHRLRPARRVPLTSGCG
jgi:phage shock protein PspC (stress-responsive transcriptional regulator)